ncbi:MAG TPA: GNAT family N-acetyltransferase [Gammaproteobacteria bacterium]|nr:GNAT family N-acetyltransferase [Gammaproteobacteria bacterium]
MQIQVHASIDGIPATGWNNLAGTQPFLRHEFLAALEHSGCVGAATGWQPQHLTCTDESGKLIGALPLYLKSHSWGEYVFDWAWAEAYQRAGKHYYPKLAAAVPFSPVTGPRLLALVGTERHAIREALVARTVALAAERHASSVHCLFPEAPETGDWQDHGFLLRKDCQFHWHNRGYRNFDEFLASLSAEKRKKIKRERRRVQETGITFQTCRGGDLDTKLLQTLYRFYAITYAKHGHASYLNLDFFKEIARTMPDSLLVNFAKLDDEPVACAVCFRNRDTLYGRHWGCAQEYHSLHFEACYYQGIDYCIREGLEHFNPGTQGEHKLARGFEPTATWSMHYIAEPTFHAAIADYLQRETHTMDNYIQAATRHLPFGNRDAGRRSRKTATPVLVIPESPPHDSSR